MQRGGPRMHVLLPRDAVRDDGRPARVTRWMRAIVDIALFEAKVRYRPTTVEVLWAKGRPQQHDRGNSRYVHLPKRRARGWSTRGDVSLKLTFQGWPSLHRLRPTGYGRPSLRKREMSYYFNAETLFAAIPTSRPRLQQLMGQLGYRVKSGPGVGAYLRLLDQLMETVRDRTALVPSASGELYVIW